MHDMPQLFLATPTPDQAAMRADLLHRALEETGKLSTALDLAERAWRFIHPWSMTAAMVADLKAAIWDGPMETEPAMPPSAARAPAPAPAAPPPPPPPCASDGMGTQVLSTAPPVPVTTEPAAPAVSPQTPIPQIYQPPAAPRARNRPTQAPKAWTTEEEATLKRMYHAGSSDKDIALAMGRTAKAVSIRCAKLGLSKARHGREGDGDGG